MAEKRLWVNLGVRGPVELKELVQKRARKELITASALVRRIIREFFLRIDRSAFEAMEAELNAAPDEKKED